MQSFTQRQFTLSSLALLAVACGSAVTPDPSPASSAAPSAKAKEAAAPAASNSGSAAAAPAATPVVATGTPAQATPAPFDPERVLAKCGDLEIQAAEVEERILQILASQMGGQAIPPEQMAGVREGFTPQILQDLINERLLDNDARDIAVTPEECRSELEQQVEVFLLAQGMSKQEFEGQIMQFEGIGLDEFLTQRASDEMFVRGFTHQRLLEERYPEDLAVTEEEVAARYEAQKDQVWAKGAQVRASHILIETPPEGAEGAEAAQEKANRVLALAQAEGADFAALAREHSEGPSAPDGGDLNFFPREGRMVEPFAAAAFALEVGEVSGLVQSQFGLHIIQVTDRKEGRVVPLEEASPAIRRMIREERISASREKLIAALRETQTIELF